MVHSARTQLVALLVMMAVSQFLLAASLHTDVNAQELTVTSNRLGGFASYETRGLIGSFTGHICDGTLEAECNDDEEAEFMMDSEARGRLLRRARYYISYGALAADRVPCRPRSGRSYYTQNCYTATGPIRPYRRSCTAITRCKRYTS